MSVTRPTDSPITVEGFNAASDGNHHGWLGFSVTEIDTGLVVATMPVRADQLNPGAGLHGGVSASFADSLCGYGTFTCLPDGAEGFTTVSLNSNYLGQAVLDDTLTGTARLIKGGRQLQVWDVTVANTATDKPVAEVRITQLLRYPAP